MRPSRKALEARIADLEDINARMAQLIEAWRADRIQLMAQRDAAVVKARKAQAALLTWEMRT